jgi:hypothetical protein
MIILGVGRSRRRLFRAGLFDAAVDLGVLADYVWIIRPHSIRVLVYWSGTFRRAI